MLILLRRVVPFLEMEMLLEDNYKWDILEPLDLPKDLNVKDCVTKLISTIWKSVDSSISVIRKKEEPVWIKLEEEIDFAKVVAEKYINESSLSYLFFFILYCIMYIIQILLLYL